MKFHTRLIGALDAVILAAAALVTVGFTAELFDPRIDVEPSAVVADASPGPIQHS